MTRKGVIQADPPLTYGVPVVESAGELNLRIVKWTQAEPGPAGPAALCPRDDVGWRAGALAHPHDDTQQGQQDQQGVVEFSHPEPPLVSPACFTLPPPLDLCVQRGRIRLSDPPKRGVSPILEPWQIHAIVGGLNVVAGTRRPALLGEDEEAAQRHGYDSVRAAPTRTPRTQRTQRTLALAVAVECCSRAQLPFSARRRVRHPAPRCSQSASQPARHGTEACG